MAKIKCNNRFQNYIALHHSLKTYEIFFCLPLFEGPILFFLNELTKDKKRRYTKHKKIKIFFSLSHTHTHTHTHTHIHTYTHAYIPYIHTKRKSGNWIAEKKWVTDNNLSLSFFSLTHTLSPLQFTTMFRTHSLFFFTWLRQSLQFDLQSSDHILIRALLLGENVNLLRAFFHSLVLTLKFYPLFLCSLQEKNKRFQSQRKQWQKKINFGSWNINKKKALAILGAKNK